MTLDDRTQTPPAGALLGIALAAIALLLVLIIWLKVHAFTALVLVSLITAFATGIPTSLIVQPRSRALVPHSGRSPSWSRSARCLVE